MTNVDSEEEPQQLRRRVAKLEAALAACQNSEPMRNGLAEVFEQAPVAMCVLRGPDLVYELANAAYHALLPNRPLLGRRLAEVVPEMDADVRTLIHRVLETGEPFRADKFMVTVDRDQDGIPEEYWFNLVYQRLAHDDRGVPGVIVIASDITTHVQATREIEQQWHIFDTALSNSPDFCYIFGLDGRFTYMNRGLLSLWQRPFEQAVGKNFFDLEYPAALATRLQQQIQQVIETRVSLRDETPYQGAIGDIRQYEYIFVPIIDKEGTVQGVAGSTRDITERKQIEQTLRDTDRQLRKLVKEKDVLVQEVHHRVKNNLQLILSLLHLHAGYTEDQRVLNPLSEAAGRVQTIARLHERLYASANLSEIEFGEYLRNLTDELQQLHGRPEIKVEAHTEKVTLDFEAAIALGLIANELIVNSFKHAFPSGKTGHITVSLSHIDGPIDIEKPTDAGLIRLRIADDGVGFPPGVEIKNASSMGLYLVETLVQQLRARLQAQTVTGVEFAVTLPTATLS